MTWQKSASFVFLSSLLSLTACGNSSSNNSASGGSGGNGAGGSAGTGGSGGAQIQCQEPSQLDVNGIWAAKVRMTVKLVAKPGGVITLCPDNQTREATLYMYMDMKQNAADKTKIDSITPHVCSVELPVVSGMVGKCDTSAPNLVNTQLQIPSALEQAFPNIALTPATATLGGTAPGASLSAQKMLFVAGSTTQGSAMPGWNTTDQSCASDTVGRSSQCDTTCVSDCSKLRDDDKDTYPGITLGVCGLSQQDQQDKVSCNTTDPSQGGATIQGRAWIDLMIDPTLSGTVKSSCEVTGHVDASITYNVVGGDVWLTGAPLAVTDAITSLPTFSVDPSQSSYRLLRVDGQHGAPSWSLGSDAVQACQTVLQHKNDF